MKKTFIYILFLLVSKTSLSQDFTGIIKYKLSVTGSTVNNTDSMSVVFDKSRIMVVLYIPDSQQVSEKIFIDDFKQNKSYRLDAVKHTYEVDTLKKISTYVFINSNSVGAAVNNELCIKYRADMKDKGKASVSGVQCLGGINYRNSNIKNYAFLGVQPLIVDNRIVMDFEEDQSDGRKAKTTATDIRKIDNVDRYFSLDGYTEIK
jgi:hypothetical protein